MQLQALPGTPRWNEGREQRLFVSMLLATLFVAGVLSVLRNGNCFKVLDDPNVGSREAFEAFGQFMVQCTHQQRNPKSLPWVAAIRQQTGYLHDPDGYVKGEE